MNPKSIQLSPNQIGVWTLISFLSLPNKPCCTVQTAGSANPQINVLRYKQHWMEMFSE